MREGKILQYCPHPLVACEKNNCTLKNSIAWFCNSWENRLRLCKSFSMIILFLRLFRQFYLLLNVMNY